MFSTRTEDYTSEQDGVLKSEIKAKEKSKRGLEKDRWRILRRRELKRY